MIPLIFLSKKWPRGGMVTQRIANPFIPVRFWAWPPEIIVDTQHFGVKNTSTQIEHKL